MEISKLEQTVADVASHAEMVRTPCGEGTMAWRRFGSGPPLLLLHGGYGSWTHWIHNVLPLSRDRTVWAPDMPGYGDSALPPTTDDLDVFAGVVVAGLNEVLGEGASIDVAGFSFGGLIGTMVAARMGARVPRLFTIGPVGLGRIAPLEPLKSWRRVTDPGEIAAINRHNLKIHMIGDPSKLDDLAVHLQTVNTRGAKLRREPFGGWDRLWQELPVTGRRTLGVWGELDGPARGTIPERCHTFEAHGARTAIVAGAGHWLSYERPEAVNHMIREFIEGPPPDATPGLDGPRAR